MKFIVGFILGTLFGFIMMACFAMSGRESRREEEEERRMKEREENEKEE